MYYIDDWKSQQLNSTPKKKSITVFLHEPQGFLISVNKNTNKFSREANNKKICNIRHKYYRVHSANKMNDEKKKITNEKEKKHHIYVRIHKYWESVMFWVRCLRWYQHSKAVYRHWCTYIKRVYLQSHTQQKRLCARLQMFVHKVIFFLIYFFFFRDVFFFSVHKAQTFIVMHLLKIARHSLNGWKSIRNKPFEKSIAVFLVIDQMLSTDLINYSNYICSTGNRQRSHTYGCCRIWKMLPKKMATNSIINIHMYHAQSKDSKFFLQADKMMDAKQTK